MGFTQLVSLCPADQGAPLQGTLHTWSATLCQALSGLPAPLQLTVKRAQSQVRAAVRSLDRGGVLADELHVIRVRSGATRP